MLGLLIIAALILLLVLASAGRRAKQREAVAGLRADFARISRLRLVAACPGLDGTIRDAELRLLFDWMLLQLYRRTGARRFEELMRWSVKHGEVETTRLTAVVVRQAVDRLPRAVLAVIDECDGRAFAAVLLDQALTEAGRRIAPGLNKYA